MRQQKEIDLIYRHTHSDYKGITDGKKCVMYYENGTKIGAIIDLPEKIYQEKLAYSQNKEKRV